MPLSHKLVLFIFIAALFSIGCAGLSNDWETPAITVSSFKAVPGENAAPKFEIGLHIVNPNRTPLELDGIAYTISLEGHKLLTGVANDLPVIDAYAQGDVLLTGTVSLFNSIAFFADLARRKTHNDFSYSFDAKLDIGSLRPIIRVNKTGTLSLDPSSP